MEIDEARTHLSKLIREVEAGREVVITRSGQPVARLVPYESAVSRRRVPGGWEGRVRMSADFDDLPPEMVNATT